jgi:Ca-activated chloride channel family protein
LSNRWIYPLLIPLLVCVVTEASAWDPLQSARRAAAQGQRALDSGDTTAAIRNLLRAQALAPEDQEIHMGLGETLYEAGDFENSQHQYESIGRDELSDWRDPALYNAGNAAFDAGELETALDLYTQALLGTDGDPGENLLFNLELTQRLLEQQQQQEQQQDKSGDQDKPQQDQQDQSQENQQQQDQQDQEKQDQQQQDQQQSEEQEQEQPQPQDAAEDQSEPAEQPAEELEQQMTPEEAMRLLQALDADEEQLRKSIQRRLRGDEKEAEHDW